MTHEMPLVIFTLAAQMSVGSFIVLGLIRLLGAAASPSQRDAVINPALFAIGPLLVLGLAASTLHLGSPVRAANSLLHLGTSWLSLEILLGIGFLVLGAAFAYLQWRGLGIQALRTGIAAATALVGVGLVFAISQVFSLRTVPAWSTWFTSFTFFATALVTGCLAVVFALAVHVHFHPQAVELRDRAIQVISLVALVVILAQLLMQPAYFGYLEDHPESAARASLETVTVTEGVSLLGANGMLITAGLLLLVIIVRTVTPRADGDARTAPLVGMTWAVGVAFGLVVFGELLLRMLFYASMALVGFGGA